MNCAPLALFAFNRPQHLAQTMAALQLNDLASQTPLFVFCDAARHDGERERVRQVRAFAHTLTGFQSVTVIERERNMGLAASITDGVSHLCAQFGRAIALEDDLVTSPGFLRFMNQGLNLYADDERVASIHGYAYPVDTTDAPESYFLRGADCWGWATWTRAWQHFESDGKKLLEELKTRELGHRFDYEGNSSFLRMLRNQVHGKNNSWAIRWHASTFLKDMLTLYPRYSLVANLGFDDSGTHCSDVDYYATTLGAAPAQLTRIPLEENDMMRARVVGFFVHMRKQWWRTQFKRVGNFFLKRARKLLPA